MALGVPVLVVSGRTRARVSRSCGRSLLADRTLAFLGASGVGKSTLVNALVGRHAQATTGRAHRATIAAATPPVAAQLLPLPGEGWLIDTPGLRALSLWLSGEGIERAFADVFELMEHCRFRDCKHDREPGCAVRAAIEDGSLDPGALRQPRAAGRRGSRTGGGAAGQPARRRPAPRRPPAARGRPRRTSEVRRRLLDVGNPDVDTRMTSNLGWDRPIGARHYGAGAWRHASSAPPCPSWRSPSPAASAHHRGRRGRLVLAGHGPRDLDPLRVRRQGRLPQLRSSARWAAASCS